MQIQRASNLPIPPDPPPPSPQLGDYLQFTYEIPGGMLPGEYDGHFHISSSMERTSNPDIYIDDVLVASFTSPDSSILNHSATSYQNSPQFTMSPGTHIVKIKDPNNSYQYGWCRGLSFGLTDVINNFWEYLTSINKFDTYGFFKSSTETGSVVFDGIFLSCPITSLPVFNIPSTIITVNNVLFNMAFMGCSNLTTVPDITFPASITSISNNFFTRTFQDCISLVNAPNIIFEEGIATTLPYGSTFDYMYSGCTSLTNVPDFNIPNTVKGSIIPSFAHAFEGCINLINAPNFNISNKMTYLGSRTFYQTFYYCRKLQVAPLFNLNVTDVMEIPGIDIFDQCFQDCINFPSSVSRGFMPNIATEMSDGEMGSPWGRTKFSYPSKLPKTLNGSNVTAGFGYN
jgi:hypothetical protein